MTEAASRTRRRGSVYAALLVPLLVLAALGLPGPAAATPTATFKLRAIPIPGYPGTGDILGAGTEVEVEVTISGTEYGGFPSPLTGINLYGPSGVKVTPTGFATCAPSVLEAGGAAGCPKRSSAGPVGVGYGDVSFGGDTVPEKVSIQGFFVPGGGLIFYVEGTTPVLLSVPRKSAVGAGQSALRAGGDGRSAARRNGARRQRRVGHLLQRQGRRGVQEGQADGLLHHPAEAMPKGRVSGEAGTEVPER